MGVRGMGGGVEGRKDGVQGGGKEKVEKGAGLRPRILKRWHKGPTMCTNHIRKGLLLRIHKVLGHTREEEGRRRELGATPYGGGQEKGTWGHSLWRRAGEGNLGHTPYPLCVCNPTSPYSPLTLPHLS